MACPEGSARASDPGGPKSFKTPLLDAGSFPGTFHVVILEARNLPLTSRFGSCDSHLKLELCDDKAVLLRIQNNDQIPDGKTYLV